MTAGKKHPNQQAGAGRRHSLNRKVERSRYAAVQTGPLRLRTWQAGGLVLHWPLTEPSTGCRRFARHEAGQTININL